MIPIAHLRILIEDAVLVARLAPMSSLPQYLHDKALVSKLMEVLNKSDSEIAIMLADPKEDISWFEPFLHHIEDPELYAIIQEAMNAY